MELTPEDRHRIYEEEKKRLESTQAEPVAVLNNVGEVPNRLIKFALIAVGGLAILMTFGWLGYHQYRLSQLKSKLDESIGRDLGLTETILKIETESSRMTFAEVFALCDKSVQARTSLIVDVRGVYPDIEYKFKEELIQYLNAENEFVRSKRDFYRNSLALSLSSDLLVAHIKDMPSSSYAWEYYFTRKRKLKEEVTKSAEKLSASSAGFWDTYEKVAKQEGAMAVKAKNAGIRFTPIFKTFATGNKRAVDDAKANATTMIATIINLQ